MIYNSFEELYDNELQAYFDLEDDAKPYAANVSGMWLTLFHPSELDEAANKLEKDVTK